MRARSLQKRKVSTIHIRELWQNGEIEKVSYGNYWGTFLNRKKPDDYKFVETCLTNEKAVICGPSACYHHGLLHTEPDRVYVATARTDRSEIKMNFPISRHYYSARTYEDDIITYNSAGIPVRVYDADRSVVDCIRMTDVIGEDMLHAILKAYKKYPKKNTDKLYDYARKMRVSRMVRERMQEEKIT